MADTKSIFNTLNDINVNGHTEKKANLTYLSWAWAWAEVKKAYPKSFYTIYENENGWFYHTDGNTAWVKTGVTVVDGDYQLEHIEYLPIMDFKNKSIPLANITSTDVNKTIQRSLTKAVARHGLGLYIYAGEDLPEADIPEGDKKAMAKAQEDTKSYPTSATANKTISKAKAKEIEMLAEKINLNKDVYLASKGKKSFEELTEAEAQTIINKAKDMNIES